MPIYVYKFTETGETIEVQQSFHDDSLTEYAHPETGSVMAVKKVFQPVGVTFKGTGFFKNDNRGKTSTTTPAATTDSSNGSSDTKSSSDKSSSDKSSSDKSATSKKTESSNASTTSTASSTASG